VYTLKKNGVKEDILVSTAPKSGELSFSWVIDTGGKLEAKVEANGGVGFYSVDPMLTGDITVGDSKSQDLLDKARKNGAKTHLSFVIPRPVIVDNSGHKFYDNVAYELKDNMLTLKATQLNYQLPSTTSEHPKLNYPISIDPSIVVTSTV
jgi:hypothetical protein